MSGADVGAEANPLNLGVNEEGDELNDETQAALLVRISAGWKSAQEGRLRPASGLLATLRARRR